MPVEIKPGTTLKEFKDTWDALVEDYENANRAYLESRDPKDRKWFNEAQNAVADYRTAWRLIREQLGLAGMVRVDNSPANPFAGVEDN